MTRSEFLASDEGREVIATGLELYRMLRRAAGADWVDAAKETHKLASILNVQKELDEVGCKLTLGGVKVIIDG